MNTQTLLSKWEKLIKQESGETVKCAIKGESQLLVKCDEFAQFMVNGMFAVRGRNVKFIQGGLLVDLDRA